MRYFSCSSYGFFCDLSELRRTIHSTLPEAARMLSRLFRAQLGLTNGLRVFFLPFPGKFIQLLERYADFLHPLCQAVGHGGRDCRLVVAVDKTFFFEVAESFGKEPGGNSINLAAKRTEACRTRIT